jgi:hypothetical protein
MRAGFRHGDRRFPFLWDSSGQPPARWHGPGDGPVQYFADTADGAWAEFLRHEEIRDPADLAGISRRLWVVELPDDIESAPVPQLDFADLVGDPPTYAVCREEARRLLAAGARAVVAPSAALLTGAARGQLTDGGLREAGDRDGLVWVLFGSRPGLRGWAAVDAGAPTERILSLVRYFGRGGDTGRRRSNQRSGKERRQVLDIRQERQAKERRAWSDRRGGVDRRRSDDTE